MTRQGNDRVDCRVANHVRLGRMFPVLVSIFTLVCAGCSGSKAFHEYARAGDTVAVAAGWLQNTLPQNITVTITPSSGPSTVYPPGAASVRAVVNMYADPVSSLVVSRETGIDQTSYASTYAFTTGVNTGGDKDWWQTVVFIDLPASLPAGTATIRIANADGETATSTLEIISGTGQPNSLHAKGTGPLSKPMLDALLRVNHYTINFNGPVVPYSMQMELVHDADKLHGGVGSAFVVNPLGYIKNVAWTDDGFTARVLMTPARDGAITAMSDFKIYIAGDLENVAVTNLQAFDRDGIPVAGVTAALVYIE
jgi:hypothetical protein